MEDKHGHVVNTEVEAHLYYTVKCSSAVLRGTISTAQSLLSDV